MKMPPKILLTLIAILVVSQAQAMRWYSPNTGRWFSRDPIGERGGKNLSALTYNDSVNWVDALGLYQFGGLQTIYGLMHQAARLEGQDGP